MEKKDNIIVTKSFAFAVRIVKFYRLLYERKEFVIAKQILRSGTSVGANIREAHNAATKKDFVYKLTISQKETDETKYWLELLFKSEIITEKEFTSLHNDASELLKILKSIIITARKNLK